MRLTTLAVFAILTVAPTRSADAQLANLLEDILPLQEPGASYPDFLGSTGGMTYFSASSPSLGRRLWQTDGTPEGTRLADYVCSVAYCPDSIRALDVTTDGNSIYFARVSPGDNASADALFVATAAAMDVTPLMEAAEGLRFPGIIGAGGAAFFGGRLVFWGEANGDERLLRTSASGTGVELIRDMSEFDGMSGFQSLATAVLFWVHTDSGLYELWRTDGTPAGTSSVIELDVFPGARFVTVAGQWMIFTAVGETGLEVWSTDGTTAHTQPLTDFADPNAYIWEIEASSNQAYFFVHDLSQGQELWTTDGTVAGTRQVSSFGYSEPFAPGSPFPQLAVSGSTAYFLATDGLGAAGLWAASPAPFSAHHVVEICPDASCLQTEWLELIDSRLFFLREDAVLGREVWSSDGTAAGTRILQDACPGACSGGGRVLASKEDRLVFAAMTSAAYRIEPFVADAPWTNAHSLFDELRGAPVLDLLYVGGTVLDGRKIYFPAKDSLYDLEPWVSEGTPASSLQLADIAGSAYGDSRAHAFASVGGTMAFMATDLEFASRMWLTDGSSATTRAVSWSTTFCDRPDEKIHPLNGKFLHLDCNGLIEVVDPATSQSTEIVIGESGEFCFPYDSEAAGGEVSLLLGCSSHKRFWHTDGTQAGTTPDFTLSWDFYVGLLEPVAGRVLLAGGVLPNLRLFAVKSDHTGLEPLTTSGVAPDSGILPKREAIGFFTHADQLWRTDGTASGTFAVTTPDREFVRLQGATRSATGYDLLLATGGTTEEIWSTDGSVSGIEVRATLITPGSSYLELPFARAENRLFAVLPSIADGPGLWTLEDGGTELQYLRSTSSWGFGTFDTNRFRLPVVGTRVFFPACDSSHGCELWKSDGTNAGTLLLQDIAPGPESSDPHAAYVGGDHLYFAADDQLHGAEVWALPLNGGPACRADELRLCLEAGRFQVTGTWRDFAGRSGDATAVPITADTGYFWFFDEDNVELILKLIDGGGFNGHHWVYYGALSNVEYTFTVTDSETGAAKRYFNPATRFASSGDITAFGPQGAHAGGGPAEAMTRAATPPDVSLAAFAAPQGLPGTCVPTSTRFCILNDRFAVTATWRDFAGHTGTANAGTLTDDTGYLWFFNEANVEVVLKMVDAGAFNQHFWVYYGALSNVEYTLTVTDTVAGGPPRIYRNALGQFGSFGDIEAFPAP